MKVWNVLENSSWSMIDSNNERQASSGEVKDLRREAGDLKELVAEPGRSRRQRIRITIDPAQSKSSTAAV